MDDPQDTDNTNEFTHNTNAYDDGWVPEAALESFVAERSMHPQESNAKTAERILDENAPLVVQRLTRLALYSKNESVSLRASAYILDRVLGKADAQGQTTSQQSPLDAFVSEISEYVAQNAPVDNR